MDVLLQNEQSLLAEPQKRTSKLEVLDGPTGRRRWPDHVKARLVAESFLPDARVCDVARRNGLAPQHLSSWRRLAREGKLALEIKNQPAFAALVLDEDKPADSRSAVIEIEAFGVVVRLPVDISAQRIAQIAIALGRTS